MKILVLLFYSALCFGEEVEEVKYETMKLGEVVGWYWTDLKYQHDHIVVEGFPADTWMYENEFGEVTIVRTFNEIASYNITAYTYFQSELVNTRKYLFEVINCNFDETLSGFDVNKDCKIDLVELSYLAQNWLKSGEL